MAARLASDGVKVSPLWLVATYLLHTIGELCLSPVGLTAMTRLAPARVAGLMMGVWFLAASVGNYLGGQMASLYESLSLPSLFGAVYRLRAGCGAAARAPRPADREDARGARRTVSDGWSVHQSRHSEFSAFGVHTLE